MLASLCAWPDPEQYLPAQARRIRRAGADLRSTQGEPAGKRNPEYGRIKARQKHAEARGPDSGPGSGKATAHAPLGRPDGSRLPEQEPARRALAARSARAR